MSLIEKLKTEYRVLDLDLQKTLDVVIKKLEVWQPKGTLEKDHTTREKAVQQVCKTLTDYREHIIERQILERIARTDTTYNGASTLSLNLELS